MEHSRGTFMDGKKTKYGHSSIDRSTFNIGNSITKSQGSQKNAQSMDKKCGKIVQILNKVNNSSQLRTVSKQLLHKPGSRLFYDVISVLLRAIDGKFQREDITNDLILNIFKMLGYNGNLNPNIFKPIGAPHTWIYCVNMMEWLAEISYFCFQYNAAQQEHCFEEDRNMIMIRSFVDQDPELIANYLKNKTKIILEECNEASYTVSSIELAIKNLNASQKDLSILEKQIEKERAMEFRVDQEIIQLNQQKEKIRARNEQLDKLIKQQEIKRQQKTKILNNYEDEINNQELTVDQMEDIKLQIKHLKSNIQTTNRKQEAEEQKLKNGIRNVIDKVSSRNIKIENAENNLKLIGKYVKGNVTELPKCDVKEFMEFVTNRSQPPSEGQCEKILNMNELNFCIEQINQNTKVLEKQLEEKRSHLQKQSNNSHQLSQMCQEKTLYLKQLKIKISQARRQRLNAMQKETEQEKCIKKQDQQIEHISKLNNQYTHIIEQEKEVLEGLSKTKGELLLFQENYIKFQKEEQRKLERELYDFKKQVMDILKENHDYFKEMNGYIGK